MDKEQSLGRDRVESGESMGHLILSRRVRQAFVIGGNIVVRVVEIDSGQVRLSISAPRDVSITREELLNNPKSITEVTFPTSQTPDIST